MARPKLNESREQVSFRMLSDHVTQLDTLCDINKRSRREIVEILVSEAFATLQEDPTDRINPA